MNQTILFERDDRIYLVGPVAPMGVPTADQLEEFAFADAVKRMRDQAPNPVLAWFAGHYVEADKANLNGAMWTAKELAIKSLTPVFMPVTVMHDPRTAVGLIADTKLLTPQADGVPRAKIDTALALWKHRFPEAVEEAEHNHAQGTLMQSMEAHVPAYSCSECGMTYHKLPGGKERAGWCDHLKASDPTGGFLDAADKGSGADRILGASRVLEQVTFTGTGLIFGTRGAKGADPVAHLESFQEEVAEFHERSHRDGARRPRRKTTSMETIEIAKSEYDRLTKVAGESDALKARVETAESEAASEKARADKAASDLETAEAEKVKADEKAEAAETKVKGFEEQARQSTLRDERIEKLGDGFKAKLGEKTRERLTEQAGQLSDEDWTARLDEVAELVGVKADADKPAGDEETVFSREETARFKGGSTEDNEPSEAARSTVVGGLFRTLTK